MNTWLPLNARSELAKSRPRPLRRRGAGGPARSAIGRRLGGAPQVRIALRRHRRARRRLRIEETLGLGQARDQLHVARGLAGVAQPGLEADARIVGRRRGRLSCATPSIATQAEHAADDHSPARRRISFSLCSSFEHGAHAIDFHALIGVDVGREGKNLRVLAGARRARTGRAPSSDAPPWCLIMPSRKSRSNSAPLSAARRAISSGVSMPGIIGAMAIPVMSACASRADRATSWPRDLQPALHHLDLVALRQRDALRQLRMSSLSVRVASSAVISTACAWWPIMPCMKRTSAWV